MKSPLSDTIQERITLLQQCTQFVALCIVVSVPHEGIVFQKLEENIPQFPRTTSRIPRRAIVLHLTTSSVVNKGLIRLQIVPVQYFLDCGQGQGRHVPFIWNKGGRPRLPQEGPKCKSEASATSS